MSENTFVLDTVDDEVGEFTLPHLGDQPENPAEQRDSLDDQIMAALVSP